MSRTGALPPAITAALLERLAGHVTAAPDAERVAAAGAPWTGEATWPLPRSTETDVGRAFEDAIVERFVAHAGAMRLGARFGWGDDMGSLTSRAQLDRVVAHVEEARSGGAEVLAGGRARPDLGPLFYEPTVLAGVTDAMQCHRTETFGPLVSVYRFRGDDEAVALANDSPYGLNASVWTRDQRRGHAVAQRLRAGSVNVNEAFAATYGSVDAPMGGMGDSGLGRRHGTAGLLEYTEPQTIAHQRLMGFTPPRGVPDAAWAGALNGALRVMRRVGLK